MLRRAAIASSLLALAVPIARPVAAQPVAAGTTTEGDREAALALFNIGRKLMEDGRYAEACPKLESAMDLAPGAGTQFNLAQCYEKLGRLASAQRNYQAVADAMRAEGDDRRAEAAQARANALTPRLSTLSVVVSSMPDGMTVEVDGKRLPEDAWAKAQPIDGGSHVIAASAPGYLTTTQRIEVKPEHDQQSVVIPALVAEAAPVEPTPAPEPQPDTPPPAGPSVTVTLGWVAGALGFAGVVAGNAVFFIGRSKISDADARCPDRDACTDPGAIDQGNTGIQLRDASYGLLGGAGAALVAATVLWSIGYSSQGQDVALVPDVHGAGIRWRGQF